MNALYESLDPAQLHARVAGLLREGYRLALVAAHDDDEAVRVVYVLLAAPARRVELTVALDPAHPRVPSLADLSFAAGRFEREVHDAFGVVPEGHPFLRPLVRHAHWPASWLPMRRGATATPASWDAEASYPFVEVTGGGVYEIPVGPVHAGLIEPGHFRFSLVGETIVKMTARLWYVHRGVERLFQGRDPDAGVGLAERVSGDSAVAHALAFTLAVEDALGIEVDEDQRAARSLLLELERIYNHVGDLGALANDAAFGVAHARAMVLRETLLRLNESLTGHRLLRGAIRPGATALRRTPGRDVLADVSRDVEGLVALITRHSVVVDRFEGTAVLSRADADALEVLGVVARASGRTCDARRDHPFVTTAVDLVPLAEPSGDVLARFTQRVVEVRQSLAIVDECLDRLEGAGERRGEPAPRSPRAPGGPRVAGLGIVEGWRGTVVHRVEIDASGALARCRVVDPSFFNWPALAVALADTIVPDFPLANKSFNLSYAGNDL